MQIIGIDEVGRGCWAGPLVAGAALIPDGVAVHPLLRDSKKLSAKQRAEVASWIEQSVPYGLGWVTAYELDERGLTKAVKTAMQRALTDLRTKHTGLVIDQIIIDGHINFLPEVPRSKALIKADDSVPAVSAASVIAKVARDTFLTQLSRQYPAYCFEAHVGYGTAQHLRALQTVGLTEQHRLSYKPIQTVLSKSTSTQIGKLAEARAADYLTTRGYSVIERNWHTSWCEIDVICSKNKTIYFVEVKYRRSSHSGNGLEYITPNKLQQMKRAALSWIQANSTHQNYALSAIEVSGHKMVVTNFIPSLD